MQLLNKEDYLLLDELKITGGWKKLKEFIQSERESILKTFTSIKSREVINGNVKVVETADSQIQNKLGKLSSYEQIINLVENSYKLSKKRKQ